MLTTLRIKNLALVADLTLEFQPGYNVITGETGAGKSILIGALNLVIGERADRTLIRAGSESCTVEAVFDARPIARHLASFLEESGLEACEDHQLVLKRALHASGANRQFVNGSPTTLDRLATLGAWLVDIHGPHDHQSLLHSATQLELLDAFGRLEEQRTTFSGLVERRAGLAVEKASLIVDEQTYAQQLDLLRFQVREISDARLQAGEEDQLEQAYRRASNAARLLQLCQTALDALGESDASLLTQAGAIGRALNEIQRLDPAATTLVEQHDLALSSWRELQANLSQYADRVELDPARLAEMEERLNLIQTLKRKYGPTVEAIVAFGEETARRLRGLEDRDAELARLNLALEHADAEIRKTGEQLSAKRCQQAPKLSKAVCEHLSQLGFRQSKFDVSVAASTTPGATGFDTTEFQFAPNPGEPARPLRAIASSGELARVMLAIKTVLAEVDKVPVLVFDEVDANVGGETAHAVGEKMQRIARHRQVLCITHLPQVAAPAGAHYLAAKLTRGGRTISEITLLESEGRVTELARMLGGQTKVAREHAEELVRNVKG